MKVFLLCVDALEYDFVKGRPFSHLKQKQFFRVHIPRECMTLLKDGRTTPYTPVVWKAIFTGKIEQTKPEPYKKTMRFENRTVNWLKSIDVVNKIYVSLIRHNLFKIGLPERLGFKRKDVLQTEDTFISQSTKPVVIHNPLKADVKWNVKATRGRFSFSEVVQSNLEVFQKERQETFVELKCDWDLFVVYTKLLDTIGHLFWQKDEIVEKYYKMVDQFAGEIQSNLPDGTFMVILSDHGMRPLKGTTYQGGQHSHHAYASFNHKIKVPEPFKITDFHSIISNCLRKEPEKQTARTNNEL